MQVCLRWTPPHPVIVTTRNNKDYIRVPLHSYYTTIYRVGVLPRYARGGLLAALHRCLGQAVRGLYQAPGYTATTVQQGKRRRHVFYTRTQPRIYTYTRTSCSCRQLADSQEFESDQLLPLRLPFFGWRVLHYCGSPTPCAGVAVARGK